MNFALLISPDNLQSLNCHTAGTCRQRSIFSIYFSLEKSTDYFGSYFFPGKRTTFSADSTVCLQEWPSTEDIRRLFTSIQWKD
jgi:hypothetical protein